MQPDLFKDLHSRSNLVLGCATGYSPAQLFPFVSSLRRTGFDGELALVVYSDQLELLAGLAGQFSIILVPIKTLPERIPSQIGDRLQNRGRMRWIQRSLGWVLPPLMRNASVLDFAGRNLHYFFHIACSRYFLYYSYLYSRRGSYSHVLLCDVRDVVFQDDPFRYSHDNALYCFMDPAVHLGDEPINTEWMTTTFGEAYCKRRLGRRISCSGTTLGDVSSIMSYLQEMCIVLMQSLPRIPGLHGVDQAVHNFLIWEGKLPGAILCENGRHAVMTLKNADISPFTIDEDGRLLNLDGSPAPVLHQYEFQPDLISKMKKL